jgi:cation diffusion facilitator family transporter
MAKVPMSTIKNWPLTRFAWLSVGAAIATLAIKSTAFVISNSVGLLSDALESIVNLSAALVAVRILTIVARPPDKEHTFGHSKAEYFSSLFEGSMILIASFSIVTAAVRRLINPQPIEDISLGLLISLSASMLNLLVARLLLHISRQRSSIALEADGQHLMTDVWTSVAILVGVGAVGLTHWQPLDSMIALIVGASIAWTGIRIIHRSVVGLMDTSLPEIQINQIMDTLNQYAEKGITYHGLRTRQAGARSFISVQIQVPRTWSVQRGHDIAEEIERSIEKVIPLATVFTHLEPKEDPRSWEDEGLDRLDVKKPTD